MVSKVVLKDPDVRPTRSVVSAAGAVGALQVSRRSCRSCAAVPGCTVPEMASVPGTGGCVPKVHVAVSAGKRAVERRRTDVPPVAGPDAGTNEVLITASGALTTQGSPARTDAALFELHASSIAWSSWWGYILRKL